MYQRPDAINVGCSPPGFPTAQFIACNRDRYLIRDEEDFLVPERCASGISLSGARAPALSGGRQALLVGVLAGAAALLLML